MPPIPKFSGLRQIIKDAGAALTREGTESIAAKTMTAEEKAYLDMVRQQMAEQEAFKAEFDVNPTVYHGSPYSKIEEFIPSKEGMSGPGIYTTTDPELASKYAIEELSGKPKNLSNPSPTVYPLKIKGNIFDRENAQDIWNILRQKNPNLPDIDFSGNWWEDNFKREYYNREIKNLKYPKDIQDSGIYTGFKEKDAFGQGNNVVVFKPESIRGEFAEYDPLKRKSSDYMSGLAGATGLGATALGASEAKADTMDEQAAPEELEYPRDPRAQPNIDPQALKQSLTDFLGNFAVVAPKGQQEGVEVSELSPIDFISPSMVTAPIKSLGKGAVALAESEAAKDLGNIALSKIKQIPELGRSYADTFKTIGGSISDIAREHIPYLAEQENIRNLRLASKGAEKRAKEAAKIAAKNPYKSEFYENPVVYHGSPYAGIEEFVPSKYGMSGPGIYTTLNPEVASRYATGEVKGVGNFVNDSFSKIQKAPTVYPLRVRGKIFDIENPQHVWDLSKKLDPSLPDMDFSGNWWKDPNKLNAYNNQVKKLKYSPDPETVKESGLFSGFKADDNIVMFDKNNLRLPWAEFNPAMKDSGNTLAGLAAAGLSFDQIKELLNKKSTDKEEI